MRISDSAAERLLKQSRSSNKKLIAELRAQSEKTKKPLQDVIIQNGILSEAELTRLYAEELHMPFVELSTQPIHHEVLGLLPEHIAHRFQAVVFAADDSGVLVAVEDPSDEFAASFLRKRLGDTMQVHITPTSQLKRALDQYRTHRHNEQIATPLPAQGQSELIDTAINETVHQVIEQAIRVGASDVHIEPHSDYIVIRYRIDGLLHDGHKLPLKNLEGVIHHVKQAGKLNTQEHHSPQYGQWNVSVGNRHYNIRATILPTVAGEKVSLRIIPELVQAPQLQELGLWGKNLEDLQKAIVQPHGMLLVSGPNGSGKSTSLMGLLSLVNSPNLNVATIEDPIEHRLNGANQVQVNEAAGITFASGLRAILNQDPNIIMISDIRDSETARTAFQAAHSGHLVFGSLHTTSSAAGIRRLLDMGTEPFVISATVRAVVGQRLPRQLCPECREAITPTVAALKKLEKSIGLSEFGGFKRVHELEAQALTQDMGSTTQQLSSTSRGISRLWKAHDDGCEHCNHSGYHGRIGIFEVLDPEQPEIQKAITGNKSSQLIHKAAIGSGMVSMQLDGLIKALRGLTTVDEVVRVTARG
jgi:type IV pilus assembly protein PilB